MTLDRVLEPLAALIRSVTRRLDYACWYSAKVVGQNEDGTLELQPDDARLPSLSAVPIRTGVAGASVKVDAGARVMIAFANADPSMPFAGLFEPGTATITFNGSTKAVGRIDDEVQVTISAAEIASLGLLSTTAGLAISVPPALTSVTVTGKITAGSPNVKA